MPKVVLSTTLTTQVKADICLSVEEYDSFQMLTLLCKKTHLSSKEREEIERLEDWYLKWEKTLCEESLFVSQGIKEGVDHSDIVIVANNINLNVDSFEVSNDIVNNKMILNG